MTDDQDDLFDPGAKAPGGKPDLLGELHSIKGLLDDELHTAAAVDNDTIPVLDEVVVPSSAPEPASPPPAARPTPRRPAVPANLEQEMEAMVDRIIDKEMPRIRVELKRVMLAELRLRGVLK